jgi:cell division protein ZapA
MTELSIRIKIGDREYPMRVNAEDEEKIRRAGRLINERLGVYKNRFGIQDMQDLLAMVAFDGVIEAMSSNQENSASSHLVEERLDQLNQLLAKNLSGS